ncbi:hypothetical protein [Microbacterium paulum]|uniref:hypothetical protein n=1 Tax=Microbacterium paulum TaxID=2707006 RepID=UPI001E507BFA|nr:hypothetical protein [Microbacterium paulum]
MATVRGAHLVGSLTYPDAEEAMTADAGHLGGLLRRIADGEPGDRFHWIMSSRACSPRPTASSGSATSRS